MASSQQRLRLEQERRLRAQLHRDGVGPSQVALPAGSWTSLLDFLCERFPRVTPELWQQRLAEGSVLDASGCALAPDSAYPGPGKLYYFRDPRVEPVVPGEITLIHEDEHIVIADKPHGLPVLPAGEFARQTLLTILKQRLQCPELVPAHRIDADTAGLVLLTRSVAARDPYQRLFREHRIRKTYHAIVHLPSHSGPAHTWPELYRNRLETSPERFMVMREVAGQCNAETSIRCLARSQHHALLELLPKTGLRHQLRVQLSTLGTPIVNDRIYPEFRAAGDPDLRWRQPLQLLARQLAFLDPIRGVECSVESQRALALAPGSLAQDR